MFALGFTKPRTQTLPEAHGYVGEVTKVYFVAQN
jgi:hypothetical protein